ncbi:MAG: saccharopine dehydrogenase NADP-binding domain-containing protein [Leptospira sp.]|nr:saccharopine dehydrogenase NADP-binding domain-containing protein [Leptospira sp.]
MKEKKWLLYGATGYTGELIAELCKERGIKPVLGGRNSQKLKAMAMKLGMEWVSFPLNDAKTVAHNLEGFCAVLHCAGPFIDTAEVMVDACLETKTHYLDITGEIPVYELLHSKDSLAQKAGILVLPGVGFDIVPTDCVAAQVKRWMPEATELSLAFVGLGGVSAGTAKSALAQAPYGSKIRKDGTIVSIPQFQLSQNFMINGEEKKLYSIPWGDVFTSYISTGIPNISVYTHVPDEVVRLSQIMNSAMPIFKNNWILSAAQSAIGFFIKGPDENTRNTGKTTVIGRGTNPEGKSIEIEIQTIEGYRFTAEAALLAVQKVLENPPKPGFSTPSLTFGADFVLEIPGTKISES